MRIEVDSQNWVSLVGEEATLVLNGATYAVSPSSLTFRDLPGEMLRWGFLLSILGKRMTDAQNAMERVRAQVGLKHRKTDPEMLDPNITKWTESVYANLLMVDKEVMYATDMSSAWKGMYQAVRWVVKALEVQYAIHVSVSADRRRALASEDVDHEPDGMDSFRESLEQRL